MAERCTRLRYARPAYQRRMDRPHHTMENNCQKWERLDRRFGEGRLLCQCEVRKMTAGSPRSTDDRRQARHYLRCFLAINEQPWSIAQVAKKLFAGERG